MARYQINHYVDLPFGRLHIFTNPAETAKAERLIKDTPKILWDAWKEAAERYGKNIVKEAKRCINSGIPPKGVHWPPLSPKYVEAMARAGNIYYNKIYYKTGQYEKSIGVHKENMYYTSGAFARPRYFVGLPTGVMKDAIGYKRSRPLTLLRVAQILEQGAPSRNIKPRPLWKPLFDAAGGKERIKVFARNAIKRQLSKYI